jgi:hypothetical protein
MSLAPPNGLVPVTETSTPVVSCHRGGIAQIFKSQWLNCLFRCLRLFHLDTLRFIGPFSLFSIALVAHLWAHLRLERGISFKACVLTPNVPSPNMGLLSGR